MEKPKKQDVSLRDHLGALTRPKNLLKTIGSQVPFASAGVEMLNQIDNERVEKRVSALEDIDVSLMAQVKKLEDSVRKTPPLPLVEWPVAVSEYLRRSVEFVILFKLPGDPDGQRVLPVAYGCLVGDDYVLTSSEAFDLVRGVAKHRQGRMVVTVNMCWYDFEAAPVDQHTGLVLCKLTRRDEKAYEDARKLFQSEGVDLWVEPPVKTAPKWTITPWLGQEVGWIVSSDSKDNMRQNELTHVEFGTSVISHFKMPKADSLKVFVTAPYPGRIEHTGSAVFGRDGSLVGIISGVEKYDYDAGRRVVVKTLLGFPRFTEPKLKRK